MKRTTAAAVFALAAALVLGSCSSTPDVAPVPAEDVAATIADSIESETQSRPLVMCPEDLPGKRGAVIVCELSAGSPAQYFDVRVAVTSVDATNGDVMFDFAVADKARTSPSFMTETPAPTG